MALAITMNRFWAIALLTLGSLVGCGIAEEPLKGRSFEEAIVLETFSDPQDRRKAQEAWVGKNCEGYRVV
jgi:hypothetical protein